MSHIFIDEYPILTFEFEPFIDKYWNIGLSQYIIEQYGNSTTYDHEKVEKILMSCFEYFISQFKDLILKQVPKTRTSKWRVSTMKGCFSL